MSSMKEMTGALYYAKFIARLVEGGTYEDLAESGLSYHTCMRYCKALKEFGRAYVHHFEPDAKGVLSRPYWKFCLVKTRSMTRPTRTKEQLAAYKRKWRLDKLKQQGSTVFTQHVPRYANGSRIGQGASTCPASSNARSTNSTS